MECFFFPSSLQCGWTIAGPWPGWRGGCASRHQPPAPAPSIQTTNASPGACRHLQGSAQALILSAQLKASTLLTKPFLVFTAVVSEDNNIHFEELKAAGQERTHFSLSAFCSLSQSVMKQSYTPDQTTFRDWVLQSQESELCHSLNITETRYFSVQDSTSSALVRTQKANEGNVARQTKKARGTHERGQTSNSPLCKD